jgi:hypothetical protein
MLVLGLPCIGFVMLLVWAFSGGNESRKNYCRAHLVLLVLGISLWSTLAAVGYRDRMQSWFDGAVVEYAKRRHLFHPAGAVQQPESGSEAKPGSSGSKQTPQEPSAGHPRKSR